MKYRNQREIEEAVAGEKKARALMLPHYPLLGLKVINTNGTREQDLICISIKNGERFRVEEKFRRGDFGDFLIELYQDIETAELGWYYKTGADLLSYVVCDKAWKPLKAYVVRWPLFKAWWLSFLSSEKHPKVVLSPKGIGLSLNLAVGWDKLPVNLYKTKSLPAESQDTGAVHVRPGIRPATTA